jgi:hypothetical protein
MDINQIPAKSEKGRTEIETRAHKLDFRHRQMLILVDGKTPVHELRNKAPHLGEVTELLNHLAAEEFILLPSGRLATAAPAATSPVKARQETSAVLNISSPVDPERLAAAKKMASRLMYDAMGPDSEMFTIKLEATKSREDFMAHLTKCRDVLAQVRGKTKAEQFWQTIITALA